MLAYVCRLSMDFRDAKCSYQQTFVDLSRSSVSKREQPHLFYFRSPLFSLFN